MTPATMTGLGSLASGVGSILGGLGFGKSKAPDPAWLAEVQAQSSLSYEKRAFDQKMELAKSHGLHPLAVLGVPTSSFAPAMLPSTDPGIDFSAIGTGFSDILKSQTVPTPEKAAAGPVIDPRQDRLISANVDRAEAEARRAQIGVERDAYEFERSKLESMARLMGQAGRPSGVQRSNDAVYGSVQIKPDEQKSARSAAEPHVTAGLHPFLSEFQVSKKRKGLLPQTFADDAEIPMALLPLIIQENVAKYGLGNTLRAFGFGEGQTDDPISRWLTQPGRFRSFNPRGQGRFSSLNR
ncbi:DNA pilot protein [Apis mellifera associated microvirus 48]|nr:DNA pilot protein [Apis mellifera associated microvirus 48]